MGFGEFWLQTGDGKKINLNFHGKIRKEDFAGNEKLLTIFNFFDANGNGVIESDGTKGNEIAELFGYIKHTAGLNKSGKNEVIDANEAYSLTQGLVPLNDVSSNDIFEFLSIIEDKKATVVKTDAYTYPDGTQHAVHHYDDGTEETVIYDMDGSVRMKMTEYPLTKDFSDIEPEERPDGSIIYTRIEDDGKNSKTTLTLVKDSNFVAVTDSAQNYMEQKYGVRPDRAVFQDGKLIYLDKNNKPIAHIKYDVSEKAAEDIRKSLGENLDQSEYLVALLQGIGAIDRIGINMNAFNLSDFNFHAGMDELTELAQEAADNINTGRNMKKLAGLSDKVEWQIKGKTYTQQDYIDAYKEFTGKEKIDYVAAERLRLTTMKYNGVKSLTQRKAELEKGLERVRRYYDNYRVVKDSHGRAGTGNLETDFRGEMMRVLTAFFNNDADVARGLISAISTGKTPEEIEKEFPKVLKRIIDESQKQLDALLGGETVEHLNARYQAEFKSVYGKEDVMPRIEEIVQNGQATAGFVQMGVMTAATIILGALTGGTGSVALDAFIGFAESVGTDYALSLANALTSYEGLTSERHEQILEKTGETAKFIGFGMVVASPISRFLGSVVRTGFATDAAKLTEGAFAKGAIKGAVTESTGALTETTLTGRQIFEWIAVKGAELGGELGSFTGFELLTEDKEFTEALGEQSSMLSKMKVMNGAIQVMLGSFVKNRAVARNSKKMMKQYNQMLKDSGFENAKITEHKSPGKTLYTLELDGKKFTFKTPEEMNAKVTALCAMNYVMTLEVPAEIKGKSLKELIADFERLSSQKNLTEAENEQLVHTYKELMERGVVNENGDLSVPVADKPQGRAVRAVETIDAELKPLYEKVNKKQKLTPEEEAQMTALETELHQQGIMTAKAPVIESTKISMLAKAEPKESLVPDFNNPEQLREMGFVQDTDGKWYHNKRDWYPDPLSENDVITIYERDASGKVTDSGFCSKEKFSSLYVRTEDFDANNISFVDPATMKPGEPISVKKCASGNFCILPVGTKLYTAQGLVEVGPGEIVIVDSAKNSVYKTDLPKVLDLYKPDPTNPASQKLFDLIQEYKSKVPTPDEVSQYSGKEMTNAEIRDLPTEKLQLLLFEFNKAKSNPDIKHGQAKILDKNIEKITRYLRENNKATKIDEAKANKIKQALQDEIADQFERVNRGQKLYEILPEAAKNPPQTLRQEYDLATKVSTYLEKKYLSRIDVSNFDVALNQAREVLREVYADETLTPEQKNAAKTAVMVKLLPKTNAHQHTKGSLPKETALLLARQKGFTEEQIADIEKAYEAGEKGFDTLTEFNKAYGTIGRVVSTEADYNIAIESILRQAVSQGQLTTEIRCACDSLRREDGSYLSMQEGADAIINAIESAKAKLKAEGKEVPATGYVFLTYRGKDWDASIPAAVDQARQAVKSAQQHPDMKFGFDIAGPEDSGWGPMAFKEAIDIIQDYNKKVDSGEIQGQRIGITMHAGETPTFDGGRPGWQSVEEAITLGADRVGHGVQAVLNESTMQKMKEAGITVEICGVCNIQSIPINTQGLAVHPLQQFIDRGINVSLCTDNDALCGSNITKEYLQFLMTGHSNFMNWNNIVTSAHAGIDAAFIPTDAKAAAKVKLNDRINQIQKLVDDVEAEVTGNTASKPVQKPAQIQVSKPAAKPQEVKPFEQTTKPQEARPVGNNTPEYTVTRPNGRKINVFEGISQDVLASKTDSHLHMPPATTVEPGFGVVVRQAAAKAVEAKRIILADTVEETLRINNENGIPLKFEANPPKGEEPYFYKDSPWGGRQKVSTRSLEVTYGKTEYATKEYNEEYGETDANGKTQANDVAVVASKASDNSAIQANIAEKQYEIIDPATGERRPLVVDDLKPGQTVHIIKKAGVELRMVIFDKETISLEGETLPAGKLLMLDSEGHPYNGQPVKRLRSGEVEMDFDMSDPLQARMAETLEQIKALDKQVSEAKTPDEAKQLKAQANDLAAKLEADLTEFVTKTQEVQKTESANATPKK